MTRSLVASGVAAILLHGFLLFGLQLDTPAVPVPAAPGPMVVGLVASAPQPGPAAAPAAPAPKPEPPAPREPAVPERPAKRPVRAPKEPPSKTKASETAREEPLQTPTPKGGIAPQGSTPDDGSTVSSTGSGGVPAGGAFASALPRFRSTPPPPYPAEARREHQEGVVLLDVEVASNGRPTRVAVKRSSGARVLDDAAVTAVRRWTFEPARTAGLPVDSRLEIPIRFRLDD